LLLATSPDSVVSEVLSRRFSSDSRAEANAASVSLAIYALRSADIGLGTAAFFFLAIMPFDSLDDEHYVVKNILHTYPCYTSLQLGS
jgi:hypothetical protein